MASDDSEDEIFFGSVISTKERKKMERLRDRKTLIIDGSAGPLYRPSRGRDRETRSSRNNSLVVDHGSPASANVSHVIQSSAIGISPASGPQSSVPEDIAATPTGPRESLLRVQQVLGEVGSPGAVHSNQEDLKQQAGPENSSAVIAAGEQMANSSGMESCEQSKTDVDSCVGDDMDCNYVQAALNVTSDALSVECITHVGMDDDTSTQIANNETSTTDANQVSSLSFDLKCTNESSVYGHPKASGIDGVLSSGYNPQPPFDFSQHVTGLDHQQTPLSMLVGSSDLAKGNPAGTIDQDDFSDFSHHDPSLYPVPAVHCDYSYLSNRFSIISTAADIDASNACPPSLPVANINTTTSAQRDLMSPSLPVNEQTINDTESTPLEDEECRKTPSLSPGNGSISPAPPPASVSMTSSFSLSVNPLLSSDTSLKTHPSLASLQSFMESSLVTPPPNKTHTGRLALKVPSFSTLSSDELVTPPPAPLRHAGIVEESDEDVATTPRPVVFGLYSDSEDDSIPTRSPVAVSDETKDSAVTQRPVVFGLDTDSEDDSVPIRSSVARDNDGERSFVAATVSERASPIISVDDLSRMLDSSSLTLLADVALAELEESLAVVECSFKHPDETVGCSGDAEHCNISVTPMAMTPGASDVRHNDDRLSSNKFVNGYMSPRPAHQTVTPAVTPGSSSSAVTTARTPAVTPGSSSSAVTTARTPAVTPGSSSSAVTTARTPAVTPGSSSSAVTPATTPCSPAREKFFAFARQWKEGNSAQKSPFKGGGVHDVDNLLKHRVVRNMCEELGADDEMMDTSEQNKLPNPPKDSLLLGLRPSNCDANEVTVDVVDESVMLNIDPVKEGAADVVRAIECGEESRIGANCTKPRMSYFSALDVIDVAKRELFGTFITEEGEDTDAENKTPQIIHTTGDYGSDSSANEGDARLEYGCNESSNSLGSRTTTTSNQDQQSTLAKIHRHQQSTLVASAQHHQSTLVTSDQHLQRTPVTSLQHQQSTLVKMHQHQQSTLAKMHQHQQSTLINSDQHQQSTDVYVNPEPGPSGLQAPATYTSCDDTSYLEDYPSDCSRGPYDTSCDSGHPDHRFNDTLEQMELLLQASEKYKLEQAVLQQQLALEAAVEAAGGQEQQRSDEGRLHASVGGNEGQLPSSVNGNEGQLPSSADGNDGHLHTAIDGDDLSYDAPSDSDATLGNESISICDVAIDETNEGGLEGLDEAEAMEEDTEDNDAGDYLVLSPKKRTVTSEVFDSAFNPTMDSTHASCARLSPEFPTEYTIRAPSPDDGRLSHCLPPVLGSNRSRGSIQEGTGKVVIGNACAVEEYEEFDESTDSVENNTLPTPASPAASRPATTSYIPASSCSGIKDTPVKPPRKINGAKTNIKSLPVAVVSPSITRSSSATRENSSGRYAAFDDKNLTSASEVQRSGTITNASRSQSASRLHVTSPGKTMTACRSPVSVSKLNSAQHSLRTPNERVNIHKPSSTGNLPRSVADNKASCSRSPFKTPSRPMTTPNKYPSTSSLTTPRPNHASCGQTRTPIPSHIPGRYLTPQSRSVVREIPGVLTTNSARKIHVAGAASGSRVKQLSVPTPTSRLMSPVARSLLINPPPPLLTTVKPRTGIDEHRLMHAKIDRIQKGLDRLTAKSPQVSSSPCLESPSCPPSSPTTRRCPTLPPAFYSQPSNLCLEGDKENEKMRRPCCAQGGRQEEGVTKPQVLRHTGRVLMPQSDEAANTSQSMMEVSVCERHSITYTDTLRAKQHH